MTTASAPSRPASEVAEPPSLAEARLGVVSTVVAVVGDDPLAHRLAAAGVWQGVRIERIGSAPFGDPLLFRLHGYRLALRRSEAERVRVVPGKDAR